MSLTPKQQLEQVNNPNLLSILSTIQGLPLSNEDVTSEVTTQTPLVTQILEGLVGKAQGANATADKILEGYSAYVGQELLNGTAKDLSKKVAIGEITLTENVTSLEIFHGLGKTPKAFAIIRPEYVANTTLIVAYPLWYDSSNARSLIGRSGGTPKTVADASVTYEKLTAYAYDNTYCFKAGTYYWMALA